MIDLLGLLDWLLRFVGLGRDLHRAATWQPNADQVRLDVAAAQARIDALDGTGRPAAVTDSVPRRS